MVNKTIDSFGHVRYFLDGMLHREDGPAVELSNGSKFWYIDNLHHRIDGPASIWYNGDMAWWHYGKRHRLDGPAIIWGASSSIVPGEEWWYNDKQLDCKSQVEFEKFLRLKAFW